MRDLKKTFERSIHKVQSDDTGVPMGCISRGGEFTAVVHGLALLLDPELHRVFIVSPLSAEWSRLVELHPKVNLSAKLDGSGCISPSTGGCALKGKEKVSE